jgi:hypothetical protein
MFHFLMCVIIVRRDFEHVSKKQKQTLKICSPKMEDTQWNVFEMGRYFALRLTQVYHCALIY